MADQTELLQEILRVLTEIQKDVREATDVQRAVRRAQTDMLNRMNPFAQRPE